MEEQAWQSSSLINPAVLNEWARIWSGFSTIVQRITHLAQFMFPYRRFDWTPQIYQYPGNRHCHTAHTMWYKLEIGAIIVAIENATCGNVLNPWVKIRRSLNDTPDGTMRKFIQDEYTNLRLEWVYVYLSSFLVWIPAVAAADCWTAESKHEIAAALIIALCICPPSFQRTQPAGRLDRRLKYMNNPIKWNTCSFKLYSLLRVYDKNLKIWTLLSVCPSKNMEKIKSKFHRKKVQKIRTISSWICYENFQLGRLLWT